jgi:hypothetical protein
MANTLKIIKKGTNKFWHIHNGIEASKFTISNFSASIDGNKFNIIQNDGAVRFTYLIENITIKDESVSGSDENYTGPVIFWNRLIALRYTPFYTIPVNALTTDELDAIQNANNPSASNPFATIADIAGGSGLTPYIELDPDRDFEIADLSRLLLPIQDGSPYGVYTIPLGLFTLGNRLEVLAQYDATFTTVIVIPNNVHVIFNGIDYNNDYIFIPQGTKAILINKGGNNWVMTYEVSETRKPFSLELTLEQGRNTGGTNILVDDADAIELENGSLLKKGTYDFGGNGGISQVCSVGYEKNWQAGIDYVFDNSGFIRTATNCFNVVPGVTFDSSLKFKIGSRWILDDGTIYICTDATIGAAIWQIAPIVWRKNSNVYTLFNNIDQSFEFWDLTISEDYPINIWSQDQISVAMSLSADFVSASTRIDVGVGSSVTSRIYGAYKSFVYNTLGKILQLKAPDTITGNWVQEYPDKSGTFAMTSDITTAINNLKDGVASPGDTLQKLYNLYLGASAEVYVANIAARDAYNVLHLPFSIFVLDDGDGRWAKYQATTTGVGATFVKLSDPDLLNAVMSAAAIKAAYESNSDTNAFTNALKSKLEGIDLSQYLLLTNISSVLNGTATNKAFSEAGAKALKDLIDALSTGKQDKMSWISSSSPYTGTSSTALQKLSNSGSSGNGSFPAKANTRYKIEVQFQLSGLSSTTNSVQFGILGSAGITSVNGQSLACKSATLISSNTPSYTAINSATISAPLMTTGAQAFARATITIEVVTSTAGTLIIAFATNVSTTPVVENHLIRFIDLGTSSQAASTDIV